MKPLPVRAALAALLLVASPAAARAQRVTTFAPVRNSAMPAVPARPLPVHRADGEASGVARFAGNFIGGTVGALAGWGAGYVFVEASNTTYANGANGSPADLAIAGSVGAMALGAVGSSVGAGFVNAPRATFLDRAWRSAIGWGVSLVVGAAVFGRENKPSPAAVLGTITVTQGVVLGVLAPRH